MWSNNARLESSILMLIQSYFLGQIECRKVQRYQLLNQRSEREYLGKLYCLRRADRRWISDPATRNWLREMTSAVIRGLLIGRS